MTRVIITLFSLLLLSPLLLAANNWQSYQDKAMSLYQQGQYEEAEVQLQLAIHRADKADNGDKFKASSLNLLAFVHMAKHNKQQALITLDEALVLARKVYPDTHPTLAVMLFNKGDFLEQSSQQDKALLAYQDAWLIQQQDLVKHGDAAIKTAGSLVALNNRLQHYKATVAVSDTLLETYNTSNPTAFNEYLRQISYALAVAQMKLNNPELAQAALAQELNREQMTLTEYDSRIADTLERLAASFDIQNKQAGLPLRQQAMNIRSHNNEPSLANVMNLNELALEKLFSQQFEQAKSLFQQALDTLKQLDHQHSIEQALILGNLGSVEEELKDKDKALELYLASIKLHQEFPSQARQVANIAGRAAVLYYAKRDYKEAEPLFLQAFTLLETAQAPKQEQKIALENLVTIYDALRMQKEKYEYMEKLKELTQS